MARQYIMFVFSAFILLFIIQNLDGSLSNQCEFCFSEPSCVPPVSYVPVPQPLPIKVQVPKTVIPPPSVTIPNIILALLPPSYKKPAPAPKPTASVQSHVSYRSFYPSPQPIVVPVPQPQPYVVPVEECACTC